MKHLALALILLSTSSNASSADQPQWQGTWAASAGSGATFAGTWSAVPGETPDTVAGAWSLQDQNGTQLATGTWAAGKDGKLWKGTWQARRPSGQIYDGSWKAEAGLPNTAHFANLFEAAMANAVSGSWRMAGYAGGWTIRTSGPK